MIQANPNLGALWIPEAGSAEGAVAAKLETGSKVIIMHADVTPTTLEHIKAGNIHKALNPNQGIQGYVGFIATFMAAHPGPDRSVQRLQALGLQPDGHSFIDNGFAVITKDNADDFDLANVYMEGSLSNAPERTGRLRAISRPAVSRRRARLASGSDHVR